MKSSSIVVERPKSTHKTRAKTDANAATLLNKAHKQI